MTEPAGTERPARSPRPAAPRPAGRKRLPKGALRVWAWIAGVLAFLAPWSALKATPTPEAATAAQGRQVRPLIIRKIIRRVIVITPVPRVIQGGATYSGGGSTSTGSGAPTISTTTTGGGGGGTAPPPPVSTGGS